MLKKIKETVREITQQPAMQKLIIGSAVFVGCLLPSKQTAAQVGDSGGAWPFLAVEYNNPSFMKLGNDPYAPTLQNFNLAAGISAAEYNEGSSMYLDFAFISGIRQHPLNHPWAPGVSHIAVGVEGGIGYKYSTPQIDNKRFSFFAGLEAGASNNLGFVLYNRDLGPGPSSHTVAGGGKAGVLYSIYRDSGKKIGFSFEGYVSRVGNEHSNNKTVAGIGANISLGL